MRNRPSGTELLDIAREVLKEKIIPDLAPERRYDALMVANAMAIVMRQIDAGGSAIEAERQMLTKVLGIEGSLESLNRELAVRIRHGDANGLEIWRVLHDVAQTKVAESNPRYL